MSNGSGGISFSDPGLEGANPNEGKPGGGSEAGSDQLVFPFWRKPTLSWTIDGRQYAAGRDNGRLHAAVDLLAPFGTKIRAIADGTVVYAPMYFYEGTNEVAIDHGKFGVVRYGEISIVKSVPLRAGQKVEKGEHIAYVGLLNSGASMLHFELYRGTVSGSLTNTGNPPFQRRSDLRNPTKFVNRLYKLTF
jgi:murein DD-endopeptidase MepM/ murein hydrolase activator NlpD